MAPPNTIWHKESFKLKETFGMREGFEICPNQFFHRLIKAPPSRRPNAWSLTLMGIHHHCHGNDLKPRPVMIVRRLSCLTIGSEHRVTDFKTRERSMDCKVTAQLGDHLSGHRCQSWQVDPWDPFQG